MGHTHYFLMHFPTIIGLYYYFIILLLLLLFVVVVAVAPLFTFYSGKDKLSFGFGGTGKKSFAGQFDDYGEVSEQWRRGVA